MNNAQNGARIKVFPGASSLPSITGGGSGYVRNITFLDFHVENVDNPIIVTSCYNSNSSYCAQYPTKSECTGTSRERGHAPDERSLSPQ